MAYGLLPTPAVGAAPVLLKVTLPMLWPFCRPVVVNSEPAKVNVLP